MLKVFKIMKAGEKPESPDLVGLLIAQTAEGYYLVAPGTSCDAPKVLAHSILLQIPKKPLIMFHFHYLDTKWTLSVDQASEFEMNGTWQTPEGEAPQDEDSWTASGSGVGVPGEDEARAAAGQ
jgi:hypothetical protein